MAKALVTGGAGFIGSHVADELIKLGHSVVVLDDLSGGFRENVNPKARFVKGSVTDTKLVQRIFEREKIEYVFHLAAYAAEGLSHFIKKFNYENNLIGSINLINASVNHDVKCFVFTSSIAVYGKNQLPMKEEFIPQPEDSYGIAKLAVEQELKASHEMFGLNYVIFRPHNVYGERQNIWDKYRNVVGIFMRQILEKRPLTIFGDGKQMRAFTYIGDVAPVIARSISNKKAYGQIFNIGADKPYSLNQLVNEVCGAMGVSPQVVHLPERNEVKYAHSAHKKLERYFRYKPKHSIKEGLARTAGWVKSLKNMARRKVKEFRNIEIEKNMPSAWAKRGAGK
jgi:UDP-glucose 4-epimerase